MKFLISLIISISLHACFLANFERSSDNIVFKKVKTSSSLVVDLIEVKPKMSKLKSNSSNKKTKKIKSDIDINHLKEHFFVGLRELIENRKYYPKEAKSLGHSGLVKVQFEIFKNGEIKNIKVLDSSKSKLLDNAALRTIQNVGSYKPFPKQMTMNSLKIVQVITYRK